MKSPGEDEAHNNTHPFKCYKNLKSKKSIAGFSFVSNENMKEPFEKPQKEM